MLIDMLQNVSLFDSPLVDAEPGRRLTFDIAKNITSDAKRYSALFPHKLQFHVNFLGKIFERNLYAFLCQKF